MQIALIFFRSVQCTSGAWSCSRVMFESISGRGEGMAESIQEMYRKRERERGSFEAVDLDSFVWALTLSCCCVRREEIDSCQKRYSGLYK